MFHSNGKNLMRKFYYIIVLLLVLPNTIFSQREATHTITDFEVNTSTNKFSFDIYSQNTGLQSIRVGLTSYYFNIDSSAFSSPVLSNVNPKYTIDSPTGDYTEMTTEIILGEIAVTILFTGNGDGTGDTLSTIGPLGELICTVTLDITDPGANLSLSWDQINSTMNTPTFQTITNIYQGSYVPTVAGEFEILPTKNELYQNYPNPFNPITIIKFSLPEQTQLKINIYNMLGELVETLAEGTYEAGYHKVTFSAIGGSASGGNASARPGARPDIGARDRPARRPFRSPRPVWPRGRASRHRAARPSGATLPAAGPRRCRRWPRRARNDDVPRARR